MAQALRRLLAESECEYVFTSLQDRTSKLSANTLANQHRIIKKSCTFNPGAQLHALKHIDRGRQAYAERPGMAKISLPHRIETTMRYLHPDQEDLLEIAGAVQDARSKRVGVTTIFTTPETKEVVVASKLQ
jgi:hypothetical protein